MVLLIKLKLETKENKIIIKGHRRKNWEAAFEKMAQNNDDILLDKESLDNQNSWDEEEWLIKWVIWISNHGSN